MSAKQKCLAKVKLKDMIAGLEDAYELVDREEYEAAIELLAIKHRIGLDTKTPKGRNLLFLVLEDQYNNREKGKNFFKFFETLVKAGADPYCLDKYQFNLLHIAGIRRSPEQCQLLLNYGVDPNALSCDGYLPLDYSLRGYLNENMPECLSVLLHGGTDPSLPRRNAFLPDDGDQTFNLEKWIISRSEQMKPERPEEERLRKAYYRTVEQLRAEKGETLAFPDIYEAEDGFLFTNGRKKLVRILRNSSLDRVVIPDGVEVIADGAFSCCFTIKSIVLPQSLVSIEPFAFYYCTSLESVVIPKRVTNLFFRSFAGCLDLQSVVLPDNLATISDHAFDCCPSLRRIVIPGNVAKIFSSAFAHCPSLTLQVQKGSYAEAFAKDHDIPYQLY